MLLRKGLLPAVGVVAAFLALFAGCTTFRPKGGNTRLAVYVGDGARSCGVFRWIELIACAEGVQSIPVDAAAIRSGALDDVDILVAPGGKSVTMAKALGEEGRSKIRSFVANGGGYIGTCAGCCLLMEPSKCHPDMMNMIPFTFGRQGGKDRADLLLHFNSRAKELIGIEKGDRRVRFSLGPVLVPSLPVTNAEIEVVAAFASDVNTMRGDMRPSMAGQTAAVAGTYGKGRLFGIALHPEYDVADHDILRGAFRYVSGVDIDWCVPQRRRGQLSVGVVCDDSLGVESARFLLRLIRSHEFDLIPLNGSMVSDGALRRLDAVLIPDCIPEGKPRTGLFGGNINRTREFILRGGRIFAWGAAAEFAKKVDNRINAVADGEAAEAGLRAFAAEPVPVPKPFPAKVAKPIRAAIYADKGGSNVPVAEMLSLAPEYELTVLDADDYRAGTLEGFDLVVQPGGWSKVQYDTLGKDGVAALKRYVTGGGRYFGICAGAFLVSQPVPPTERGLSRLGLIPFKADSPSHYRGWAPIKVSFTDAGREALGIDSTERTVMYWGGPAFIEGDPLPDSDVKVWGNYVGRTINTHSSVPVKELAGKAAFVGGRVGRGQVFVTCPHPEKSEANFDIVKGGIKFLTGVEPSPVNNDRVRGALAVYFRVGKEKDAAEFYLGRLLRDRRIDATAGSHLYADMMPHLDAVVIAAPFEKEDEDIAYLKDFAERGGRVIVVVNTEAKRRLAGKIPCAIPVESYDDIMGVLF